MGVQPLEWFQSGLVICLGLIVGSFVNVVIHRLPHGKSVVKPRSHCPSCKKQIPFWHNIPVISYILLRGKCSNCKSKISIRYPIVEILVALLFFATYQRFGMSYLLFIRDWPFVSALVAITFIDLDHRIIPDQLSLGGLVLGLATSFFPGFGWVPALVGAAIGFGVFYGLGWVYFKMTGRSGLGGGDVKLLAMMGAFLGPLGVFYTVLISSVVGSVVGIIWAIAQKKSSDKEKSIMTLAIPYGPFLVLGGLVFYLLGDVLWLRFTIPT